MFDKAKRLKRLPPYLFKEIDRKKAEVRAKGVDIIDLGIGDPDLPTPGHIIEALQEAAVDSTNHRYPSYSGMLEYRAAVADWYKRRFGVELDPDKEVLALIGSKEGIAHMPLAFINPGDVSDAGLPGLQHGHDLCRGRVLLHAPYPGESVPSGSRRDTGGRSAESQAAVHQLSQQSNGGGGGAGFL